MKKKLLYLSLFLLLFQGVARYAAAPVVDFTLDDWSIAERAKSVSSPADAWQLMLSESNRPLGIFALMAVFSAFGDHLLAYSLLSILTNSIFLLSIIGLTWLLLRNLGAVLIAGSLFCVLPNLTESFHWPTMLCYGPGFAAFPVSALLWVRYAQRGGRWNLLGSVLAYAVGLGTYELGIALPAVFFLYGLWRRSCRWVLMALIPFAGVLALYLTWRLTAGFGHAQGVFFVSRTPSFSLYGIFFNFREIVGWWLGGGMMDSFRNGINGFAQMDLWPRRWLFVGNVAAVSVLALFLRRVWKAPDPASSSDRTWIAAVVFGLAWAAATHVLSLVSWTGGRLNYVPAVGVVVAVAAILSRFRSSAVIPAWSLLVFVLLFSVQGTAHQWRQSGQFSRNLYQYLERNQAEWAGKEMIWMDTRSMRSRRMEDLLSPLSGNQRVWAHYGNAGLLRGFAPSAMVRLIAPEESGRPQVLLDVECGVRQEGDTLVWHERYDPSRPHEMPMADVYRVDCLSAGQKE